MLLIVFLLITQSAAANLDLLKVLFSGNFMGIYNLTNPRSAIIQSTDVLTRIHLSNYEKNVIWGAFKGNDGPQNLTADDLRKLDGLLPIIPEHDLCDLNLTDWNIVETLGKVRSFSRSQVSVLADALKIEYGLPVLTRADPLNGLSGLICGFPEDDLSTIPKRDFKKIKAHVFENLTACSDSQLRVLHDKVVEAYGVPQTWRPHVGRHIGMVILSFDQNEIRSLRPAALRNLDIDIIRKYKPELLRAFTPQQLRDLIRHVPSDRTKNKTGAPELEEICFLMGLFLRAYLLLKF